MFVLYNLLSQFDLLKKIPEYVAKYPFLSEVDSCSLRSSITDMMVGYERCLNKKKCYLKTRILNLLKRVLVMQSVSIIINFFLCN